MDFLFSLCIRIAGEQGPESSDFQTPGVLVKYQAAPEVRRVQMPIHSNAEFLLLKRSLKVGAPTPQTAVTGLF